MNVDECIKSRRSIRKFYDIPVPFEYITDILEVGINAPSAGNLQAFKFIVVTDDEKRLKLSDACLNQSWISTAPVIIIICSEVERLNRMYGIRGKKMYSIQDCALCAENMLLKAHDLGLGACFVAAFENDMVRDILDIPKEIVPLVVIPIGYPDEKVPTPAKYDVRDITFFDTWENKDITNPWPLIKFAKPIAKKTKTVGKHLKEKIYDFVEKLNIKQKKDINAQDIDKRIEEEQKHFKDYES